LSLISVNGKSPPTPANSAERAGDYSPGGSTESISPSLLRETEVLVRLACFGYLNSKYLEEFLFDGSTLTTRSRAVTTQQILVRLRRRGLVAATPGLVGGPSGGSARLAYYLTGAGQRLVDTLESRTHGHWKRRGTLFVGHALATAELALAFRRAARSHAGHDLREWESDWDAAEWLQPSRVVPDGRLVYRTPSWEIDAFVEIDLGTERTSRYVAKLREYLSAWRSGSWRARLASWPLVLTVTTSSRRASALRGASEQLLRSQRDALRVTRATEFDFAALPDVHGPKGPLGEIWQVAGRDGRHTLIADDRNAPSGLLDEPMVHAANGSVDDRRDAVTSSA
jgi:hypothetical protein